MDGQQEVDKLKLPTLLEGISSIFPIDIDFLLGGIHVEVVLAAAWESALALHP